MTEQELMKRATWVCCPLCDEKKCVGRYKCQEIERWCNKHREVGAE